MFKCNVCAIICKNATNFVNHLKIHSNVTGSFLCTPCNTNYASIEKFLKHLKRYHIEGREKKKTICLGNNLVCSVRTCKENVEDDDILCHLRNHLKDGIEITCPIFDCNKKFKLDSSFRSHISRKHPNSAEHIYCLEVSESIMKTEELNEVVESNDCEDQASETFTEEKLIRNNALFYLKLESELLVPASTVQLISEEIINLNSINCAIRNQKMIKALELLNLDEKVRKDILTVLNQDTMKEAHGDAGVLRSSYMRSQYYHNNFDYVKPETISLGKNKINEERHFMYIPIEKTLSVILKDISNTDEFFNSESVEKIYSDINDGEVFHNLSKDHGKFVGLMLYQDEFEIVNPIGSSRTKHKVLAFYYSLTNFRSQERYQVKHQQLVLMCKSSDLKEFGKEKIFKPIIDELRILENKGVFVKDKMYPLILHSILGDNLGSHMVGGFVENFSTTSHCCRFCETGMSEMQTNYSSSKMRTPESYQKTVESLLPGENMLGVKNNSEFNKIDNFHVSRPGLPPCIAHDLLEGVVSYDLFLYIQYFVKKKWFTFDELNRLVQKFNFKGNESKVRPNILSGSRSNLGGTAAQNWNLLRFFPLIMQNYIVDTEDSTWQALILLQKIVSYVFAPCISIDQVAYLKTIVEDYLELRLLTFPDTKLRPKHHFMTHYWFLILKLGPLINFWTMRFEAKHQFFKRLIRFSPNFINVLKLMSTKHQMNQAYLSECCNEKSFFMHDQILLEQAQYSAAEMGAINSTITQDCLNESFMSSSIEILGTKYSKNAYMILRVDNCGSFVFGKIKSIVSHLKSVTPEFYFVFELCNSSLNLDFGVYTVEVNGTFECINVEQLPSYYPLYEYKFNGLPGLTTKFEPLDNFSK